MAFPQARLETPVAVVAAPARTPSETQPAPTPASAPAQPAALADVIEGTWVIQIQNPVFGTMVMRISFEAAGLRSFEAVGVVAPPGWSAQGTWEILPGEQLIMQGNQSVTAPFPQSTPYQTFNQFFSITQTETHSMSGAQEALVWRRE
jgi:hypothetical protein